MDINSTWECHSCSSIYFLKQVCRFLVRLKGNCYLNEYLFNKELGFCCSLLHSSLFLKVTQIQTFLKTKYLALYDFLPLRFCESTLFKYVKSPVCIFVMLYVCFHFVLLYLNGHRLTYNFKFIYIVSLHNNPLFSKPPNFLI